MTLVRGGITVKPHVQRCADAVVAEFGASLSPGTYNGHSPPEGPTQALDLFNPETPAGWALQGRVADWLIKNQKRFGVRYVIKWDPATGRDQIWNIERADEGWRAMATRDHRDHVHVTFYSKVEAAEVEPDIPTPEEEDDMAAATWFRYAFKGQDYVIDRIKGTRSLTTHGDQLKVLDKLGCVQLGEVSAFVDDYFRGLYGD